MMFSIAILLVACTKVDELTVITDETTMEEEAAVLKNLLSEIKKMAENETCENTDDWKFTGVGSTCCGPEVYIAYSNKIDEKVFLENVEAYTNARKNFDIKWDLLGICDLIDCKSEPVPKSINCENGKAVLTYEEETTMEQDQVILDDLLARIIKLTESEVCENADDWKFTAIGKKSCGKLAGYIAYSKNINEAQFLKLVNAYSLDQFYFNLKWDVFTDCDVEPEPKGISCIDDKAVLNYNQDTTIEYDLAILDTLLAEIKEIAESVECQNANEWKFTAIGSKACGGPTGYIAYSEKIDETEFLELVDAYTKAMNDFNIKWGIFSTCDVEPAPKSVSCVDGKAVLNY